MNAKSKRKFRFWDNRLLFQTLEKAIQVKENIEARCTEDVNPQDLPMSIIPTAVLYDIAICYEAMYDKLLEEELIVAGYPKSSKSYH